MLSQESIFFRDANVKFAKVFGKTHDELIKSSSLVLNDEIGRRMSDEVIDTRDLREMA